MNKMIDKYLVVSDEPMTLPGVHKTVRVPVKKLFRAARDEGGQVVALLVRKGVRPESMIDDSGEFVTDKVLPYGVLVELSASDDTSGKLSIDARGLCMVHLDQVYRGEVSLRLKGQIREYEGLMDEELPALREKAVNILQELKTMDAAVIEDPMGLPSDPIGFVNTIATRLEHTDWEKYFASFRLADMYRYVLEILQAKLAARIVKQEIERKVSDRISQSQREYFLREEMKVIQEELGDGEDSVKLREAVANLKVSEEISAKLNKEIDRLDRMNMSSPEYAMLRNYLDWVLTLPWGKVSQETFDPVQVRKVLDEDHFGMDRVKERILEYMSVRKLTQGKGKAPVLCLVGAPGVGKTSIAQSIARALGKEYVHISLGGVRDEAEIRGHRKTYIGAIPGRIMTGMSKVQTSNPLMLLDEIDKMTSDMRGDPAGALLEVLDPNQNAFFRDSYLEVPFDLSQVLFITTANSVANMDKALLDRLEVIEMPSYTRQEKYEIAVRHLIPKQSKNNGINALAIEWGSDAVYHIIDAYTREAGVRELERQIGAVCRKIAMQKVAEQPIWEQIGVEEVEKALGVPKFDRDEVLSGGEVGAVNGLAYTSVGGVVMPIEAKFLVGKGEIILTGSLGDVMKESAKIALSVVKENLQGKVAEDYFATHDLHLHVPAGATPKDGPSAGIAIACAIRSAALGCKTDGSVAMTGELSLRGKVLPIGGLKEKVLAAHRSGIRTVLVPSDNHADVQEVPQEVSAQIKWIEVRDIAQVFKRVCKEKKA